MTATRLQVSERVLIASIATLSSWQWVYNNNNDSGFDELVVMVEWLISAPPPTHTLVIDSHILRMKLQVRMDQTQNTWQDVWGVRLFIFTDRDCAFLIHEHICIIVPSCWVKKK